MRYNLFYIVSIVLFLVCCCFIHGSYPNLNGGYIGVDFGHSSFRMKVMEPPKTTIQVIPSGLVSPRFPPAVSSSESSDDSSSEEDGMPFRPIRTRNTPPVSGVDPSSPSSSDRSFMYVSSPASRFTGTLNMSNSSSPDEDEFVHVPNSSHFISRERHASPVPKIIKSLGPCSYQNKPENYPSIFLKGGHGTSYQALYIGAEAKIGYNLAHNSNRSLSHEWNLGTCGKVGVYATSDWIIYIRIGVDFDQLTLKNEDNVYLWSLVRGIGTDHMISEKIFLSFCVEHAVAISHSASVKIVNRKTSSITIKTGMGFKV